MTDPDFRALCAELVAALDPKVVGMEGYGPIAALLPRARAVLAQTELQELSDLRARIEILEAALHRHIMQTSSGMAASKVLDLSDLPQLTPEQVQNLQDLLGTYRSQALADRVRAARRSKPPSLKEQALAALDDAIMRGDCITISDALPTIRRALEQLPDHE